MYMGGQVNTDRLNEQSDGPWTSGWRDFPKYGVIKKMRAPSGARTATPICQQGLRPASFEDSKFFKQEV